MIAVSKLRVITLKCKATQFSRYRVCIDRVTRVDNARMLSWECMLDNEYPTYWQAKAKLNRVNIESKLDLKCEKPFACVYILGYDNSNKMWFTIEERSTDGREIKTTFIG